MPARLFPQAAAVHLCLLFLPAAGAPTPVPAQETETVPGVDLGMIFDGIRIPPIAIKPLTVYGEDPGLAREIEAIIALDLEYSDDFLVMDSLPAGLGGEGVQYALWEQFAADWLVTGTLEAAPGGGLTFAVELHDIVFGSLKAAAAFSLPPRDHPDFRLAVHSVSDALVQWVTGDRGVAATRILFRMQAFGEESGKEVYSVDFDGGNLRRLTWDRSIATSPVWSPDGKRIAYGSFKSLPPRIYELNLADGRERLLVPEGHGQHDMPSYHPDGSSVAFAIVGEGGPEGLFTYDIRDGCCLRHLGGGRFKDSQPGFSPDGERLVFMSTRLGFGTPQVYLRRLAGGGDELLSPFRYGEGGFFTDPDWSPCGDRVAFAGGIGSRRQANRYHILVAEVEVGGNRLLQLTQEGNNEDPSWAPNCRHIVFQGTRSYGSGVFVVDTETGRTRLLVANVAAEDTDWSPLLAEDGVVR